MYPHIHSLVSSLCVSSLRRWWNYETHQKYHVRHTWRAPEHSNVCIYATNIPKIASAFYVCFYENWLFRLKGEASVWECEFAQERNILVSKGYFMLEKITELLSHFSNCWHWLFLVGRWMQLSAGKWMKISMLLHRIQQHSELKNCSQHSENYSFGLLGSRNERSVS